MASKRSEVFEEKPSKKKRKSEAAASVPAEVNVSYNEASFREEFGDAFRNQKSFKHENGATVISYPFSCCVLPNFLKDDAFLEGLKEELLDLTFEEKSNDLYKFLQSGALQNFKSPHISGLRNFLYEDFRSWLRDVTGIQFDETMDLTCSKYSYTDCLLCHDDELGGRRLAFILYLVPEWTEQDGGTLDLFKMDEHGRPDGIVKSLLPQWNNFVFFEVTPASFHQVAEVLSQDKCRLSVSGWFHGTPVERPSPYVEPRAEMRPHTTLEEDEFYDWVNPLYLDVLNQSEIQERFTDDSEIQLEDFLEKERYDQVCKDLRGGDVKWQRIGPANYRNYETADLSTLPQSVLDCLRLMQSEHMFLTLSNFTGLKLHENAPDNDDGDDEDDDEDGDKDGDEKEDEEAKDAGLSGDGEGKEEEEEEEEGGDGEGEEASARGPSAEDRKGEDGVVIVNEPSPSNPRCRAQVRRWTHGCYTLMHDTDTEGCEFALDAVINFNRPEDLQTDHGGFTSYIAKAEAEELLSVTPENNALSLVYRDKETLRFVKHLNHRFRECQSPGREPVIHDIQLVYYE